MNLIPGDILACYGGDLLSRCISLGTSWPLDPFSCLLPPSHVAIVTEWQGRIVLVESTTQCERYCLFRNHLVEGVQVHHPADRINDYIATGGRVDVWRLHGLFQLDDAGQRLLTRVLFHGLVEPGHRYDLVGAMRSGFKLRRLFRSFWQANLDHVFCSELVAAVLMRCGVLNHDDPAIFSPGRLIREIRHLDRYRLVERDYQPPRVYREAA